MWIIIIYLEPILARVLYVPLSYFSSVWLCVTLWTVVCQVPLATRCEELIHWKRPWCWERLNTGGKGNDRGWDGWMASPTRRTWAWASSGSWWWRAAVHGVAKSWTRLSDWTELMADTVSCVSSIHSFFHGMLYPVSSIRNFPEGSL